MTKTPTAEAKTLQFIGLVDDTGRTTSLAFSGKRDDGFMHVVGVLPHNVGIRPATTNDAIKLIEWCLATIGAQPSTGIPALLAERDALREALQAAQQHLEYCGYGDKWERECAVESNLEERINSALANQGTKA